MHAKRIKAFQKTVLDFYSISGRHDLPWRTTTNPYRIAVSEIMLQQTQVPRVIEKYRVFLTRFPTIRALAKAPLGMVITAWSGLGYNRRAKFLHRMAQEIVSTYKGKFPTSVEVLESLPGIGPYTARAIAVFAYNEPVAFIETNIRTVYFHHFFPMVQTVSDKELLPIVSATLDQKNPRQWYNALMDYGTNLKAQGNKIHRNSAHYTKQSTFAGSRRQIRGAILKLLIKGSKTTHALQKETGFSSEDIFSVLDDLLAEEMVNKQGRTYCLAVK